MAEEKKYTFRCVVCGWEVTVDTPELPEDFVCEVCGVGPDQFELVEERRAQCSSRGRLPFGAAPSSFGSGPRFRVWVRVRGGALVTLRQKPR